MAPIGWHLLDWGSSSEGVVLRLASHEGANWVAERKPVAEKRLWRPASPTLRPSIKEADPS